MRHFILIILLFVGFRTTSQPLVNSSYEIKHLENGDFKVVISLNILKGWNMISPFSKDSVWHKFKIVFDDTTNFNLIGNITEIPESKTIFENLQNQNVRINTGAIMFTQKIRKLKNFIVNGHIEYMLFSISEGTAIPPCDKYFTIISLNKETFIYGQ